MAPVAEGRAGPAAGAGGALCAQAHSGPLRQGAGRPVQARAAAAAPRGGDQGPRSAAQPETMAEQQAQAVLFGTDGHPAHLHRGALGRGRHGDDLRRDHRGDAQRRAARQGPDGPYGDPARRRSGEVRQGDARRRAERSRLPEGVLFRRGDQARRRRGGAGAAGPDAKPKCVTRCTDSYISYFSLPVSFHEFDI